MKGLQYLLITVLCSFPALAAESLRIPAPREGLIFESTANSPEFRELKKVATFCQKTLTDTLGPLPAGAPDLIIGLDSPNFSHLNFSRADLQNQSASRLLERLFGPFLKRFLQSQTKESWGSH